MSKEQINSIQKKNETDQYISVYSPINGTVTKLEINEGMYVNEGTMIYEIVNLDQVWLDAEIYEQDIAYVTENSKVEAISPAYPDTIFTGKILFITPYLEPISRTVKIKANLDNKDGLLKPGMYVSTEFKIPGKKKSLVIPVTALLDTGVRKLVYVSQGNGRYLAKSVIVSPRNGDIIPVLSGLKEGEQIVTYGVFLIDSQAELTGTGYIEYEEPHAKILF
ncbi:MAG: hypothetical protein A2355_03370 [Spirochaetes bacterium RIFOXYB1_FULL_32_8]|nr:MAG: hypothetical protein A2355_03370 [Spirochaetes bacterium RIFOXYB1_FULL_32_8]